MTKQLLNEEDYAAAARTLSCEVAAVKAVTEVEAPRGGFIEDGRVRILFERHKFFKFTGGRFAATHPDICNKQPGGYGAEGAHQYARFSRAFKLDPKAAMMSASWGKFQIMGFNFAAAGFRSVDEMIDAMKESEGRQLQAFVKVVISWQLADELRRHDWSAFARQYNGANYRINRYDLKLDAAYKKHKRLKPEPAPPRVVEEVVGSSVIEDITQEEEVFDAVGEEPRPEDELALTHEELAPTAPKSPEPSTINVKPVAPADETQDTFTKAKDYFKAKHAVLASWVVLNGGAILNYLKGGNGQLIVWGFIIATICSALIGVVYVWRKMTLTNPREARDHAAREAERARAHELTMAQIESASRQDRNTVVIKPAQSEA